MRNKRSGSNAVKLLQKFLESRLQRNGALNPREDLKCFCEITGYSEEYAKRVYATFKDLDLVVQVQLRDKGIHLRIGSRADFHNFRGGDLVAG